MITARDHSNDYYWAVFILLYEVVQSECVNAILMVPTYANKNRYPQVCVQSFAKPLATAG